MNKFSVAYFISILVTSTVWGTLASLLLVFAWQVLPSPQTQTATSDRAPTKLANVLEPESVRPQLAPH